MTRRYRPSARQLALPVGQACRSQRLPEPDCSAAADHVVSEDSHSPRNCSDGEEAAGFQLELCVLVGIQRCRVRLRTRFQ